VNHLRTTIKKIQHDSTTKKSHSTHNKDEWRIPAFDFLGPISQELGANLSDFNPGDIIQIQDRSQQYHRPIYVLQSNER
jgi:hypothetical protein